MNATQASGLHDLARRLHRTAAGPRSTSPTAHRRCTVQRSRPRPKSSDHTRERPVGCPRDCTKRHRKSSYGPASTRRARCPAEGEVRRARNSNPRWLQPHSGFTDRHRQQRWPRRHRFSANKNANETVWDTGVHSNRRETQSAPKLGNTGLCKTHQDGSDTRREVRDEEAVGSNPATPTNKSGGLRADPSHRAGSYSCRSTAACLFAQSAALRPPF
jgi:hypothetical protein